MVSEASALTGQESRGGICSAPGKASPKLSPSLTAPGAWDKPALASGAVPEVVKMKEEES